MNSRGDVHLNLFKLQLTPTVEQAAVAAAISIHVIREPGQIEHFLHQLFSGVGMQIDGMETAAIQAHINGQTWCDSSVKSKLSWIHHCCRIDSRLGNCL